MKCWFLLLSLLLLLFNLVLPGQAEEIRVLLVGDIMLDWQMVPYLKKHGYDYPFANLKPYLAEADIIAGNLEMPVGLEGERAEDKSFAFLGRPQTTTALRDAGFSVVTLANNHIMDYGPVAFADTLRLLDRAGIAHCGAGPNLTVARRPAVIESKGRRFSFLGYSNTLPDSFHATEDGPGTVRGLSQHFGPDIAIAATNSDMVIATFHWGGEYLDEPRDYQKDFAHRCIRAGAKVVFGHHPHILQGVEVYEGGVVAYSLGNFTFGSYNDKAKRSVMMEILFEDAALSRVEFIPINVLNTEVAFQPRVLSGDEGGAVIAELNALSAEFGTKINWDGKRGILQVAAGQHGSGHHQE